MPPSPNLVKSVEQKLIFKNHAETEANRINV